MATDPGSGAQAYSAMRHRFSGIRGFRGLASVVNCGVITLTLGSYALSMSTPVFWLSWSLLVMEAIIAYVITPYWKWATPQSQESAADIGIAGSVFLKVGISIALIVILVYNNDFGQRENKTIFLVGLSIILCEGFPQILLVREEFNSLLEDPWGKAMEIRKTITDGHNSNAVNFLIPSVINSMICVTGSIVLGGNLGSLMPQKAYWVVVLLIVVDLKAEAIHRFSCGRRSLSDLNPERLPESRYIAVGLRLVVGSFLCYFMVKEICQKSYFPSHMDVNACNAECQERSKVLLMAMVVLGGFQAAAVITTPVCAPLLGPKYVPYTVFYALLLIGCLLFLVIWPLANFLQILMVKYCTISSGQNLNSFDSEDQREVELV